MIASMRIKWTSKRIMVGKTDIDAAYRRVHTNAQISATCISIVLKIAFLCLHLPFGITPSPEEYNNISKASIDLGNDILTEISWDVTNLKSPHPREDYLSASDPLVKVYQLAVYIKAK